MSNISLLKGPIIFTATFQGSILFVTPCRPENFLSTSNCFTTPDRQPLNLIEKISQTRKRSTFSTLNSCSTLPQQTSKENLEQESNESRKFHGFLFPFFAVGSSFGLCHTRQLQSGIKRKCSPNPRRSNYNTEETFNQHTLSA